ncbi:MAG TPA: FAD-binding oxidoreductase, partial [Beijerinckiaceae bacterium]|nr:FAD-binding oxidoreductase [Beijerinckiaceae bacterium]
SAQERNLWTLRDEIPPLKLMQGKMLKWDAAVPIDRIVPFLRTVERCAAERLPGARVYAFGHVGDGNLHLSVWPSGTPGEAGFDALCAAMERAIDELVWSFGGTICAEHGVGVENFARLVGQKPAIEFEMMAAIRRLFDPTLMMNPGKIFDPGGFVG